MITMSEWDEFRATLLDAGWNEDEIEIAWNGSANYREKLLDAVYADGRRDLCASVEDFL